MVLGSLISLKAFATSVILPTDRRPPQDQKKLILVYDDSVLGPMGRGTSQYFILQTLKTFSSLVDGDVYQLGRITPSELIAGSKLKETKLLIFPGGRDRPYHQKLKGAGNEKIKTFVKNGGSLLGFCAGAYYFAEEVTFNPKNKDYAVNEKRELGFFPGAAKGPALGDYNPFTSIGVKAAALKLSKSGKTLKVFYNGGGYFEKREKKRKAVEVLALYKNLDQAAIVFMKVGRGRVLLSGVHPEQNPEEIPPFDETYRQVKRKLLPFEGLRKKLLRFFLEKLRIN